MLAPGKPEPAHQADQQQRQGKDGRGVGGQEMDEESEGVDRIAVVVITAPGHEGQEGGEGRRRQGEENEGLFPFAGLPLHAQEVENNHDQSEKNALLADADEQREEEQLFEERTAMIHRQDDQAPRRKEQDARAQVEGDRVDQRRVERKQS